MSHYDFLLGLEDICFIHSPVFYEDGTFSVLVEDCEGYYSVDIHFDEYGDVIVRR